MTTDFLHGVETVTVESGPKPVQTIRSSVIGLIGTAPDATGAFPLNTPVLVNSRGGMAGLGDTGTLPDALSGIFDQFGAFVVVIRVAAGVNDEGTMSNIIGDPTAQTGIYAFRQSESLLGLSPMILLAPGYTGIRPQGINGSTVGTPGTGYTTPPAVSFSGGAGTGAAATAVLTNGVLLTLGAGGTGYTSAPTVSIAAPPAGGVQATATATVVSGAVTGFTVTNNGKGYLTPPAVSMTGGGGTGATATAALTGRVGSLLFTNNGEDYTSAPTVAFTGGGGTSAAATVTIGAAPNPVVSSLLGLASMLRAHVLAEGPNTTDSDAIAYRGDWDNRRLFITDPAVSVFNTTTSEYEAQPNSPVVAGIIAATDYAVGFWQSPSNQAVGNIGGLGRPVDWAMGDPNSRANLLNSNQITTFIRDGGWYLWGNRTASSDATWAFLSVSRTADMIDISIAKAHRWAVDRAISKGYLAAVTNSVNKYLRQLVARGAILGGKCWVDPDLNSDVDLSAGHVTFSYDFTPPAPAERVTFQSSITDAYVSSVFSTTN